MTKLMIYALLIVLACFIGFYAGLANAAIKMDPGDRLMLLGLTLAFCSLVAFLICYIAEEWKVALMFLVATAACAAAPAYFLLATWLFFEGTAANLYAVAIHFLEISEMAVFTLVAAVFGVIFLPIEKKGSLAAILVAEFLLIVGGVTYFTAVI